MVVEHSKVSKFVNLDVRDFDILWLVPTHWNEPRWLVSRLPPLVYFCVYHLQLSQDLSFINFLLLLPSCTVPSWSSSKAVYKPVWHIPVPSVQWINSWWWAEELPETCGVSCRNKFGKLVYLVAFIIKKWTNQVAKIRKRLNVALELHLLYVCWSVAC
jgi:hypothetical protein